MSALADTENSASESSHSLIDHMYSFIKPMNTMKVKIMTTAKYVSEAKSTLVQWLKA